MMMIKNENENGINNMNLSTTLCTLSFHGALLMFLDSIVRKRRKRNGRLIQIE